MEESRIAHRAGARVSVELNWSAPDPVIEVVIESAGLHAPSPLERAAWEHAVVQGVRHALNVVGGVPCGVRVTELGGDPRHVKPTMMGAAAAQAVWEALEFEPPSRELHKLRLWVDESLNHGPTWLAPFGAD